MDDLTPAAVYVRALNDYQHENPEPGLLDPQCRNCGAQAGHPCPRGTACRSRTNLHSLAVGAWQLRAARAAHGALDKACAEHGIHPATVLHTDLSWGRGR